MYYKIFFTEMSFKNTDKNLTTNKDIFLFFKEPTRQKIIWQKNAKKRSPKWSLEPPLKMLVLL